MPYTAGTRRLKRFLTASFLLIAGACASTAPQKAPMERPGEPVLKTPAAEEATAPQPEAAGPVEPEERKPAPPAAVGANVDAATRAPAEASCREEEASSAPDADQDQTAPSSNAKTRPGNKSDQELLDSALGFCQASDDYWQRGDLENAIDALDEAYSLILRIKSDSAPDILQQRDDLRVTISKRIVQVYSSRYRVANGTHKAIPLETNEHVQQALNLLNGQERDFFLAAYQRSGKYRPAILRALKEAGLPEELSWLPLIESGFKVRALSCARALGMWQFIASTGYKYGLKRDRWTDERMDPEKSTAAAIAYLKELHQIFGDWTTALAAYNCGEGRVLKVISSQKINYLDNFWDLYRQLPVETAFYVPKFMAVLQIVSDPAAHGFVLPPPAEELVSEKVTIDRQVHLKTIAEGLHVPVQTMQALNPELRYDSTPNRPYELRVPPGTGGTLLAMIDNMPVWQPPAPAYVRHKVRKGETLSGIARRYGTDMREIMRANGLHRSGYIKAGWTLKIPARGAYAAAATSPSTKVSAEIKEETLTLRVRKGDSLWSIANRYGTTVSAIQSLNALKDTRLQQGQVLKIRGETRSPAAITTRSYTVNKGDSPYLIAQKHQMDLSEFLTLNRLTPRSTIFPGQILLVKAD